MPLVFVRPAVPGTIIPRPGDNHPISGDGEAVEKTFFIARRIRSGDLEVCSDPLPGEAATDPLPLAAEPDPSPVPVPSPKRKSRAAPATSS